MRLELAQMCLFSCSYLTDAELTHVHCWMLDLHNLATQRAPFE